MTREIWLQLFALAAGAAAILAIAACTDRPADQVDQAGTPPGDVYDFTTADGTRCIAWKPASGGALACDFKGEIR